MKTYEETAVSALGRIREHEARSAARKRTALMAGVPFLTLGLAAAVGYFALSGSESGKIQVSSETEVIQAASIREPEAVTQAQAAIATTTAPSAESVPEAVSSAANDTDEKEKYDICYPFYIQDELLEKGGTVKIITSYPETTEASYKVPELGKFGIERPLYEAMEEYGSEVYYRVRVAVFTSEGNEKKQTFDAEALNAEAKRLYELGYTAGLDRDDTVLVLTVTATKDQIRNFPASENYAYFLALWDRYEVR